MLVTGVEMWCGQPLPIRFRLPRLFPIAVSLFTTHAYEQHAAPQPPDHKHQPVVHLHRDRLSRHWPRS